MVQVGCQTAGLQCMFGRVHQNMAAGAKFAVYN